MAKTYSRLPSDLVELRGALPQDARRFDLAVMLYAQASEARAQWWQQQELKQGRGR